MEKKKKLFQQLIKTISNNPNNDIKTIDKLLKLYGLKRK